MQIHTPKGIQSLEYEADAITIYTNNRPNFRFVHTDKDTYSAIDGMLVDEELHLKAVVEIKTRNNITSQEFAKQFNNEWLLSYDKITRGMQIAELLKTALVGFLYLTKDNTLHVITLWCPKKGIATMRLERTATQKNTNDQTQVWRDNAYINMEAASVYKG